MSIFSLLNRIDKTLLPHYVKTCKKHGKLLLKDCYIARITRKNKTYNSYTCQQCKSDSNKKRHKNSGMYQKKKIRTSEYFKEKYQMTKRRIENFTPEQRDKFYEVKRKSSKQYHNKMPEPYIRAQLKHAGFDKEQITPELIELKRSMIKLKRLTLEAKKKEVKPQTEMDINE